MWRRWSKSSVQKTHPSNSSLSSASFKDIQILCAAADGGDSRLPNTKISYVFHRVRAANSILRSFSSSSRPDSDPQSVIKTPPPPLTILPQSELQKSPPPPSPSPPLTTLPQSELQTSPPPPPLTTLPQSELQKSPPPPSPSPPQTTLPQLELQKYPPPPPSIAILEAEKRIVVYFTSLRVVRSTFEDCRFVQSILRAFRVSIDERDLAMDSGFIKELQQIFGGGQRKLTLPCVFIGGRYIGGADEIRDLHDAGELKKLVVGLAAPEPGGVCDVCGGYRFVLCTDCNGSHKMYIEKFGFKSCVACNENGLIRCSSCLVQSSLDMS